MTIGVVCVARPAAHAVIVLLFNGAVVASEVEPVHVHASDMSTRRIEAGVTASVVD